uniref:Extensin-like protein n=1 Tax=Asparagus officinalis TaxID=4686 RepID=Q2XNX8_ASPOF|nr:extensin-like protein [Asparagus officinalis]
MKIPLLNTIVVAVGPPSLSSPVAVSRHLPPSPVACRRRSVARLPSLLPSPDSVARSPSPFAHPPALRAPGATPPFKVSTATASVAPLTSSSAFPPPASSPKLPTALIKDGMKQHPRDKNSIVTENEHNEEECKAIEGLKSECNL